jgi:hypothetical protein
MGFSPLKFINSYFFIRLTAHLSQLTVFLGTRLPRRMERSWQ